MGLIFFFYFLNQMKKKHPSFCQKVEQLELDFQQFELNISHDIF